MIDKNALVKAKLHVKSHVDTKEEKEIIRMQKQIQMFKRKSINTCNNIKDYKLSSDDAEEAVKDIISKVSLLSTTNKEFEMWRKIILAIKNKNNQ